MLNWRGPFPLHLQSAGQKFSGFAAGHHSVSREPHPALIQFGDSSFITCWHRFPQNAWGVVSSRHSWNTAQIFHTLVKLVHLSRYINVTSGLMDSYHTFVYYRGESTAVNFQVLYLLVLLACWSITSLTSLCFFTWKMFLLLMGTAGRRAKIWLKC